MDRVWESNAINTPPAVPAPLSHGYPTGGDLATSVPATNPGAWWYHMVTQELLAVIVAAELTPSATNLGQLLAALDARYTPEAVDLSGVVRSSDFVGALSDNGYQVIPGGLIFQWGSVHVGDYSGGSNFSGTITYPIAFPAAVHQTICGWRDPGGSSAVNESAVVVSAQRVASFDYGCGEIGDLPEDATVVWFAVGH